MTLNVACLVSLMVFTACGTNFETVFTSTDQNSALQNPVDDCAKESGSTKTGILTSYEVRYAYRDLFELSEAFVNDLALPDDFSKKGGFSNEAKLQQITSIAIKNLILAAVSVGEEAVKARYSKAQICQTSEAEANCLSRVSRALAYRAYRRSLTATERTRLDQVISATTGTTFEIKMAKVISFILSAPQFYIKSYGSGKLSAYSLANRMAFTIWQSLPDEALLSKAADGSLLRPEVLKEQIQRLLADSKGARIDKTFANDWLKLSPQQTTFKRDSVDVVLTAAEVNGETYAFLRNIREGRAPVSDIVSAEYSFINDKLADVYNVAGASTTTYERYDFQASNKRKGIFTHMSVLRNLTNNPTHSNILGRGAFALSEYMCMKLDQPANVPPLPDPGDGDDENTIRGRIERHTSGPTCMVCHSKINPIGFAFETFDGIGRVRTKYKDGSDIDATGVWTTGEAFQDSYGLVQILSRDPMVRSCIVEKYAQFAINRDLNTDRDEARLGTKDKCLAREISAVTIDKGATFPDMLYAIFSSELGQKN